jgi:hypothetical protein
MVKIEEMLMQGEQVTKNQGGISINFPGGPVGDLYLTNMRLIFLSRKVWAIINPGSLMGQDIQIPLQSIKATKKGSLGAVEVQAEKKYLFYVSMFQNGSWVDAIQQAIRMVQQPPYQQPYQQPQQQPYPQQYPPPPSQQPSNAGRFCSNCGRPLEFIQQYNRWYCRTCQKYA